MEINSFNFLRWEISPSLIYEEPIPNPYLMDQRCPYMPVLISGEPFPFVINLAEGIDTGLYRFPNRGPYRLDLLQNGATILTNIGALTESASFGFTINSLFANNPTFPTVAAGIYNLSIVDIASGVTQALSNKINVNPRNYKNETCRISYTNYNKTMFNYRYSEINFLSSIIRINMAVKEAPTSEMEVDLYHGAVTGKIRSSLTRIDRVLKFETYYFDAKAHEAMAAVLAHDVVYINEKRYVAKAAYKDATPVGSTRGIGTFEAYDVDYSTTNK